MKPLTKIILFACFSFSINAETMTLEQVLQHVMDHYPSLKTAAYQVQRAKLENQKIESQLGWQLSGQAGISRDVSLFGTATDKITVAGSMSRQLASGDSLSIDAAINREDATSTFSPTLPNPATTTSIDLNYRLPFEKGADNPGYQLGLASADAGTQIAQADRLALYDQLASQVIELFLAAVTTNARIENVNLAIERTTRRQKYIKDRLELGVSEKKDVLQVNAQLSSQQAELQGLKMAWEKQKISLNRLMGKQWDTDLKLSFIRSVSLPKTSEDELLKQIKSHSPSLLKIEGRIKLAETAIESSRDAKKDNLDLVLFAGNRTSSGDTTTGSVSESEMVGGVRLEFNRGLDKSGYDAELYQAQLDRGMAIEDKRQIIEDLQYDLSSLMAEIKVGKDALEAYRKSVNNENKKLKEAEQRYRRGRTDTDQLIQFESQLSSAELSSELQRIELARRYRNLALLRGELWKNIKLPEYQFSGFKKFDGKINNARND